MSEKFVAKKSWIRLLAIGGSIEEMTPLQVKVINTLFSIILLALSPILFGVIATRGPLPQHWVRFTAFFVGIEIVMGILVWAMWYRNHPSNAGFGGDEVEHSTSRVGS